MTLEWSIRPFSTLAEYDACIELQEETWGRGFSERVPTAILKVSQILGGLASGAWSEDGRLLGFVFGMTGVRDGVPVHWSDMLAVRPEARSSGLGSALKWYQRDQMLERGIRTVYWTFDPLRARNANLNFTRLGIRSDEYVVDMYGATDSPLHRGVGTDRLVARWDLDDPEVAARAAGDWRPPPASATAVAALSAITDASSRPLPDEPSLDLTAPRISIAVPSDIGTIMAAAPDEAMLWRRRTRAAFVHYLDRGWEVRAFDRSGDEPTYILVREPESPASSPTDPT